MILNAFKSYLQMLLLPGESSPRCFMGSGVSVHVSIAALCLLVALQVNPALEAVLTAGAAERPVAAVLSAVGDEVGALAESFTAHLAHMWLLTCVYESVFLHVGFLVKPFPTVLTGIWSRVGVDEEVSGQGGRALEHLATHFAAKTALLSSTVHAI